METDQLLINVSRTFALSIKQLPCPLNKIIKIAYLLFRISDTIEDHPDISSERKVHLLNLWTDILKNKSNLKPLIELISDLDPEKHDMEVIHNSDIILKELNELPDNPKKILISNVCKTSLGMAKWQEKGPEMETEEDMDDYMYQVAGRVGHLLTEVFSWYSKDINKNHDELFSLGREFGLALQTVNIIRGLRKDFERGWIFIPKSFLYKAGLSKKNLFEDKNVEKALVLVDMLINKAVKHLQKGLTYIFLIPKKERGIRLFCIWPLLLAVKTLSISRKNKEILFSEAKISRKQVQIIVTVSRVFSFSNILLKRYYYYLGNGIFQT